MEVAKYLFLAALFSFGILHFAARALKEIYSSIKANPAAKTTAANR